MRMNRALLICVLVLGYFGVASATEQVVATFSIVAYDPDTQELAVAV